jgi:hypothetical protein
MPKKPMHPLLAQALTTIAETGKKALGRAFDSVLEDAANKAREVESRASGARGRYAPSQPVDESVGVGRVSRKKKKRVKKSAARSRRRVGEDEESE